MASSNNDGSGAVQPALHSLLPAIHKVFNQALRDEKNNVPGHVDHPPFQFEFSDSGTPNAKAILIGGLSVIAIGIPLFDMLGNIAFRLSRLETVSAILDVPCTPEGQDAIRSLLFTTLLAFAVAHEYTHHVHGHVNRDCGRLEAHALEIDADGYAVYYVLAHLITGDGRAPAVRFLEPARDMPSQDQLLLSSFVMAVAAFFLDLPVGPAREIDKLDHPPHPVRMDWVMRNAVGWCKQNKPELAAWTTHAKFQMLMEATLPVNNEVEWRAQIAFLQSSEGLAYQTQPYESVTTGRLSLPG